MLLLAAGAGIIPSLGYLLSLSGLYALGYLTLYHWGLMEAGLMLESLVEGNMILAGILAFTWDPFNTSPVFGFPFSIKRRFSVFGFLSPVTSGLPSKSRRFRDSRFSKIA